MCWEAWMISNAVEGCFIVVTDILCLAPLGESTDRLSRFWSANLGAETSPLYKWSVTSAGIFVAVALVLSVYLIFEHLAAYNKPEEQKFLVGLPDSNGSCLWSGIGKVVGFREGHPCTGE